MNRMIYTCNYLVALEDWLVNSTTDLPQTLKDDTLGHYKSYLPYILKNPNISTLNFLKKSFPLSLGNTLH